MPAKGWLRKLWPLGLLALAACASLAPAPPPPQAQVVVYRRAIAPDAGPLHIYDGEKDLGMLPGGSYLNYLADPGPRIFRAVRPGTTNLPYATSLVAGRRYYLLAYILGDQRRGQPALTQMDAATAAAQIKNLKAIPPP